MDAPKSTWHHPKRKHQVYSSIPRRANTVLFILYVECIKCMLKIVWIYKKEKARMMFFGFITRHRSCKANSYTREKEKFTYSCAVAENTTSSANIQLSASLWVDLLNLKCHLMFRAIQWLEKQFLSYFLFIQPRSYKFNLVGMQSGDPQLQNRASQVKSLPNASSKLARSYENCE